uniref:ATP-grasp domain-containing protein n=1 Tax=candidate division CPR3 bacterium TaxID=2268181 RepID=A0A7V3N5A8_UNCC3
MRIMILSYSGCGLDIAMVAKSEGHDVWMVLLGGEGLDCGEGLVNKVGSIEEGLKRKPDFVIVDDVYFGLVAEKLRKDGYIVFGGSVGVDAWENNREIGQKVMQSAGILVPESKFFNSFSEAIEFLEQEDQLYVIKFSGAEGLAKSKTVVPVVKEEMIEYLTMFQKELGKDDVRVELQAKVDGVEMAMSRLFNGNDFVGDVNVNFEHKRMFEGNLGPLCGESGTLSCFTQDDRFFMEKGLGRMLSFLRKERYVGIIDLNGILTKEGKYYGLEFTSRWGYPIQQILFRQWKSPVIDNLYKVAMGDKPDEYWVEYKYGVGTGFFVPGDKPDIPIFVEDEDIRWLGFDDIKKVDGVYKSLSDTSSWYKRVFVAVGVGDYVWKARTESVRNVSKIKSTYGWYRWDIGENWESVEGLIKKYIEV